MSQQSEIRSARSGHGSVGGFRSLSRLAFTLNEMLVVVAIIVLLLGLALPAFNTIRGSKSVEAANNLISAFLGEARAEAIGVQEIRGAMFFLDPATGQVNMALVRDSGYTKSAGEDPTGKLADVKWLSLVPDRDFLTLPAGLGIQTVDNAASPRTDDGYIGFNLTSYNATQPIYGGVILFDSYGKLISVRYGFRCSSTSTSESGPSTSMASLLTNGTVGLPSFAATDYMIEPSTVNSSTAHFSTYSQIGLAIFDKEAFLNNGNNTDEQMFGTYSPTESSEEGWLDSNSTIFLINRYNGSLLKGE